MINAEQIRSARALLDWPTSELAKRSGLTVNGLNKIERGYVNAQRDSLEKIQKVFEDSGIEFLPGSGLRRKDQMVTVHEGKNFWRNLVGDVYETLRHTGGEFLAAHMDEALAVKEIGVDFVMDQLKKRRRVGITHRMLVRSDDKGLIPSYQTYHTLPEKYFSFYPLNIFGPKIGFSLRKHSPKSIIIHDARIAESARKLFDFVWDHTEIVPQGKKELLLMQKKKKPGGKNRHD